MCGSCIQRQFSPVPHHSGQVHHQDPPPGGRGSVGASFRARPQSRSAVGGRRVMQALRVALRACPASYARGQLGAGAEAPASTGIRFTIVDVRRRLPLPSESQQSSESVVASTWRRPPGARCLLRSLEARGRSGERRSLPRPPLGERECCAPRTGGRVGGGFARAGGRASHLAREGGGPSHGWVGGRRTSSPPLHDRTPLIRFTFPVSRGRAGALIRFTFHDPTTNPAMIHTSTDARHGESPSRWPRRPDHA